MRKQSFESIRDQLNRNYGTRSKGHFGGQKSFHYKQNIYHVRYKKDEATQMLVTIFRGW